MTITEVDYSKAEDVSDQGIRLFKVMMRLEFALKDIGYGVPDQRQVAGVNWNRYTKEKLGASFWVKVKKSNNLEVLIQTPPKRQIIDQNDSLDWEKPGEVTSMQELIGAMLRVRNNLFHGGKSGDPDADRNQRLFAAALFLIDQILREDDVLQTSFSGQY